MNKVMKSFRLEDYTCRQLKALSDLYGCSQSELIELLISLLDLGVCDLDPIRSSVEYKLKEHFDYVFKK